MPEPKPTPLGAVPAALEKAERYRLLNQPGEAESICRDVLAVDPRNAEAQAVLVLALTDQFGDRHGAPLDAALAEAGRLGDDYERAYHAGLVYERWAKAQAARAAPHHAPLGWLREALRHYEQAEKVAPKGNDEAILRWNACVRLIRRIEQASGGHAAAHATAGGQEHPLD